MSTALETKTSPAASPKFLAFAAVFAISFAVCYVLCDLMGWPLFTFHPATNRVEFGWAPPRRGEGPVMYWYGWTALCLIVASLLGFLATLLPQRVTGRIPLILVWLTPTLALIPLVYSLMPFWTK